MERRVLVPCLTRDDFWWMGFGNRSVNNWNPWVNSNWLAAALLMEQDGERRLAAVAKILRSLDNFIDPYPKDGGCDEGPGYWGRAGASLFDCLETLFSATGGAVNVFHEPLIQNIGRYLYKVQIDGQYFINFADAPARLMPSAPILFRYGKKSGDAHMVALGAWAAKEQDIAQRGLSDSIGRQLAALPILKDLLASEPAQPLLRDVWFPEIQVMAAREREGVGEGLYLAAKGGHNAESHNHNDVGHFIVYADGKPVIIDAGVETYSARTFSPERYTLWTMQSAYHSLPTVNGFMQQPGKAFSAKNVEYFAGDASSWLTLDLAPAYPPEAYLKTWIRRVELKRGQFIEIEDCYEFSQSPSEVTMSLLTPCQVLLDTPGTIALTERKIGGERVSGTGRISYDSCKLSASVEDLEIRDSKLKDIWGECLSRITLKADNSPQKNIWTMRISL